MDQEIPYYKQYKVRSMFPRRVSDVVLRQKNAVTGLIAAVLCAVLFILIFIAQRFLEKRR